MSENRTGSNVNVNVTKRIQEYENKIGKATKEQYLDFIMNEQCHNKETFETQIREGKAPFKFVIHDNLTQKVNPEDLEKITELVNDTNKLMCNNFEFQYTLHNMETDEHSEQQLSEIHNNIPENLIETIHKEAKSFQEII